MRAAAAVVTDVFSVPGSGLDLCPGSSLCEEDTFAIQNPTQLMLSSG